MSKVALVTAASTGLGAATALALACAGHMAYAGIGPSSGLSAARLGELEKQMLLEGIRLRPLALDVADQRSVSAAIREITVEAGRIDVVVHGMGPVPRGPVESFTPYQLAQIYDAHVLSTQRVNRAVLPQMRERRDGLLVWVLPAVNRADTTPYLALHSETVTLIDHLAASYARELAGFGIEVCTVVSHARTTEADRHAGLVHPADAETISAYDGQYPGLADRVNAVLAQQAATGDIDRTAGAIAVAVDSPKGSRPSRIIAAPVSDRP
ncbi:SDR family NAD(P)-dependent oxidoreductase [Streptomyces sp. NPDC046870]|uniref:SDR family NAD(P)-dependent oxidoreductase n=1 Tax=Streptomyces sp. NPDC046870 TaxID=3155135 RepID=UPI003452CBE4